MKLTEKQIKNFQKKVGAAGEEECWVWHGCKSTRKHSPFPYGLFAIDGVPTLSHRVAYIIEHGNIAPGMEIAHSCDNTLCVNPRHLFEATHLENMMDMVRKGRNRLTKLNEEKAREIKSQKGVKALVLAKDYGISERLVHMIWSGERWGHV